MWIFVDWRKMIFFSTRTRRESSDPARKRPEHGTHAADLHHGRLAIAQSRYGRAQSKTADQPPAGAAKPQNHASPECDRGHEATGCQSVT